MANTIGWVNIQPDPSVKLCWGSERNIFSLPFFCGILISTPDFFPFDFAQSRCTAT
jgi:hypothetical protein